LASAPIDISAGTVNLSGGAFNIQNSYTVGGAEITAGSSLSSLKYVASANVETSVSSINTTAGGISITSGAGLEVLSGSQLGTVGGGITLIANASLGGGSGVLALQDDSSLKTSAGSILVQNLAPSGQINLGTDVTVYGSGTAKGVGQVSFVVGSIPAANTLALGLIPNGVTISQSGGAAVTFGTTSDPGGTITASGSNYLNAAGRDVVFSQGSAGSISLGGGDSITADPPVSFGPASGSVAPLSPYSPAASPVVSYSAISFAASTLLALDTSTGNSSAVPSLSAAAAAASIMANANSSSYLLNFGSNNTTVTSAIGSQPAALGSMGSLTQVGETNVALNQNAVNNVLSGISDTNSISYPLQGGVSKAVKAAKSDDKKKNIAGRIERNLERGVTLIAPDSNTTVHTGFGSVDVAANAVALIVAFDGGVAVYNLHDNKHDSIVVSRNNHRLSLTPGRNAILTSRNISSFEEVNPAQNVGYRRVAANSYDDGVKAFQAEFSLPSMFHSIGALKHLVSSSDARDQKTVRSMLKTAAILQSFGGGDAVPFEIMAAPRLTAMGLNK